MKCFLLILSILSANAQDIFVPFFGAVSSSGNNLATGLVAYYAFEEAEGADAVDTATGGLHPLSVSGKPPILNPADTGGIVGRAKSYSGGGPGNVDETDYYKRVDDVFAFSGDFTIACWVDEAWNQIFANPHFTVVSRGIYGTSLSYAIAFNKPDDNSLQVFFYWSFDGSTTYNVVTTPIGTEAGRLFVYVTRNTSTGKISISYTPAGLTSLRTATDATANTIGTFYNGGTPHPELQVGNWGDLQPNDFFGIIDELGFWNRTLSICELDWLYKQERGGKVTFDTLPCVTPTLP